MYKIDPIQNRIAPLEARRFGELGFSERKHLQEWLENCPQALAQGEGEELFLNVEQIIPTPESSEFMIGMVAKEAEEKSADTEQKQRHTLRLAFWERALEAFSQSSCTLYNNISPAKDHWLYAGSGMSSVPFSLIFGKNEIRVELNIGRRNADENLFIYERLHARREEIEAHFGQPLEWLPLPDKKSCRIRYAKPVDGYDKANWPGMIQWMVQHMTRLENALREPLKAINQQLKQEALPTVEVPDA